MGEKKEELKPQTLEEEVEELKHKFASIVNLCLPPKEVLDEVKKDLITAQISILKIFKTLLDYQIETLQKLAEGKPSQQPKKEKKIQKIKVE